MVHIYCMMPYLCNVVINISTKVLLRVDTQKRSFKFLLIIFYSFELIY